MTFQSSFRTTFYSYVVLGERRTMKTRRVTKTIAASALCATTLIGAGLTTAYAGDGNSSSTRQRPTAQQMKADLTSKLDAGVSEGTITSEQKQLILDFFEANKPSKNEDLTQEQREAEKEKREAAVETFANENNISLDFLKTLHGPKGGPGGPGEGLTQEQRKAKMAEKLDADVKAGTITQAQKDLIIKFLDEHKPSENKEATPEERKQEMDANKAAFESFANENGIPSDVLKPEGRPGREMSNPDSSNAATNN